MRRWLRYLMNSPLHKGPHHLASVPTAMKPGVGWLTASPEW